MAMTQHVQSAVMHALMKHIKGHKEHKGKHKAEHPQEHHTKSKARALKEESGEPPDGAEPEYVDEAPESDYQKYREPKVKSKPKGHAKVA